MPILQPDTYKNNLALLNSLEKNDLIAEIFNQHYNSFIDKLDTKTDKKAVPYIGFFWRKVDFYGALNGSASRIGAQIGVCPEFTGFMMNNKWDYPERDLTVTETENILTFLDNAMLLPLDDCEAYLRDSIWPYMQTLKIK